MNCLDECRHGLMTYQTTPSATGELAALGLSRRQFLLSAVSGAAAIPMLRISGQLGPNWSPALVRPPGALAEIEFLSRCIKCGQCMRICPTNVIHPAGLEGGLEGLWTPILNFRVGTSGCQHSCIACSHLCPTAAIRPLSLEERMGRQEFKERGPIKIGTAFIDRGRCLPWSMDRPCIVCQENCPVSPKAISTREVFNSLIFAQLLIVHKADGTNIELKTDDLCPDCYGTGDYFCVLQTTFNQRRRRIIGNDSRTLSLSGDDPLDPSPSAGTQIEIQIRLQQPYVDPQLCIGCGICEHECPVPGLRAIRVTADGESREQKHALAI
jgi:ferredoxin